MILRGPGTIEFRDVRYGDEAAVAEILSDWDHGFYGARLEPAQAVHSWVHGMLVRPGVHPCGPDDKYREALIAFTPGGAPLALCVYVVRGGNDPKNYPLPFVTLTTECFAIAPAQRGQGNMDALLNTLIRAAFEDTGADYLIHDLVDTPEMRSHQVDRDYKDPVERDTPKGRRIRTVFSKEDHDARMLAIPAEARQRHEWDFEG